MKTVDLVEITADNFDRNADQQFYLRMHLKCNIAYFFDYDRHTLNNLTKVMVQQTFNRGDVIFRKNDQSNHMYIVLRGKVGLYADEKCR